MFSTTSQSKRCDGVNTPSRFVIQTYKAEISEMDKMKINIFEGARRLTKLIAVIWVLCMSFYAFKEFTEKGYVRAYFRVDLPDGVPVRMPEQEHCDENDANEYLSSPYTSKDAKISVTLCFKPQQPKIVDKIPEGFFYLDELPAKQQQALYEREAAQQQAKQKKIAANFKLSKVDEEWADGVAWSKRWKNTKNGAAVSIGGLAFLWILSWCVGWIVRGFAGIPSGQDFKL